MKFRVTLKCCTDCGLQLAHIDCCTPAFNKCQILRWHKYKESAKLSKDIYTRFRRGATFATALSFSLIDKVSRQSSIDGRLHDEVTLVRALAVTSAIWCRSVLNCNCLRIFTQYMCSFKLKFFVCAIWCLFLSCRFALIPSILIRCQQAEFWTLRYHMEHASIDVWEHTGFYIWVLYRISISLCGIIVYGAYSFFLDRALGA